MLSATGFLGIFNGGDERRLLVRDARSSNWLANVPKGDSSALHKRARTQKTASGQRGQNPGVCQGEEEEGEMSTDRTNIPSSKVKIATAIGYRDEPCLAAALADLEMSRGGLSTTSIHVPSSSPHSSDQKQKTIHDVFNEAAVAYPASSALVSRSAANLSWTTTHPSAEASHSRPASWPRPGCCAPGRLCRSRSSGPEDHIAFDATVLRLLEGRSSV